MAKLEKREIIIIWVMGVVVLFGAYSFFAPAWKTNHGVNGGQKTEELNTFLNTIRGKTDKRTTDSLSGLIFAKAKSEWTPDPFLESSSYNNWVRAQNMASITKAVSVAGKKIEFRYTGYLEAGRKKIAIVNGIEYREGEKLEMKDYVLKSATPAGIIIENTATGIKESVLLQDDGGVNELRK